MLEADSSGLQGLFEAMKADWRGSGTARAVFLSTPPSVLPA